MPYGYGEQFLIPETIELLKQAQIKIIPRSPLNYFVNADAEKLRDITVVEPLLSFKIISTAVYEILRNPINSLRVLGKLLLNRNLKVLFKNLAVFPKSLWLSKIAQQWGATHIHAHWASTTSTMAMVAGIVARIPWSFTAHRGDIASDNLLEIKLKTASFTRFISANSLEMAKSFCLNTSGLRSKIIHMGVYVPPIHFNQVSKKYLSVVFCPANLIPVKGHSYLVQAMAILRDHGVKCILKIAGEGKLYLKLKNQVESLNLTKVVQFLGRIPHNNLLEFYSQGKVSIVVLPSINIAGGVHEGIPFSLIEAMAYGIPVISTNTGGIPELIGDGSGIMVEEKNPEAIAAAIKRLITDPFYYRSVSKLGREKVEKKFNISIISKELLDLFRINNRQ
jgi:glycosyltransferase involved in cell wall biosynthesis